MGNEFNFFQLDGGIVGGQEGGVAEQGRPFDKRMSNFGDLASTPVNVFQAKDELSNKTPEFAGTVKDYNPLVWDSTVKRVRADKQIIMMIGDITSPSADINAKNYADADPNYYMPNEGWRSFGGKFDTERAYQGGRIKG
jgi:hypothetical protein